MYKLIFYLRLPTIEEWKNKDEKFFNNNDKEKKKTEKREYEIPGNYRSYENNLCL